MYALGSQLASTRSIGAHHDSGQSDGHSCDDGPYHSQDDLSAGHLVMEAIRYSPNQEKAALYAQGKGTEAEQVLQAIHNSTGCHMSQPTCVVTDCADPGSIETATTSAGLQSLRGDSA